MTDSAITFTSVVLTSRGENSPTSLSSLIIVEALRSHFDAGTEKAEKIAT